MKKITGIVVIVLGLISSGMFLSAGSKLSKSGDRLTYLQSQGGSTVAEAYYQEIGRYGIAYSFAAYGMSCAVLMLACGLGGFLIFQEEKKSVKAIENLTQ